MTLAPEAPEIGGLVQMIISFVGAPTFKNAPSTIGASVLRFGGLELKACRLPWPRRKIQKSGKKLTSWLGKVVEIPLFLGQVWKTSQVVGNGISEPSTVSPCCFFICSMKEVISWNLDVYSSTYGNKLVSLFFHTITKWLGFSIMGFFHIFSTFLVLRGTTECIILFADHPVGTFASLRYWKGGKWSCGPPMVLDHEPKVLLSS